MAESQPAEPTLPLINRLADSLAGAGDAALAERACHLLLAGRNELANALINRALELRQDYDNVNLLPFHVTLSALQIFANDPARTDALELAHRLLDQQPHPCLIVVGGLSGSGKSTLARALATKLSPPLGAIWLRTDGIRKRLFGLPPEARLGEKGYQPVVSGKVYRTLSHSALSLLEQGQTVIAEATFTRRSSRKVMQKIAEAKRATFHGFWLEAPLEIMMARADARSAQVSGSNTDASDATGDIVAMQAQDIRGEITWHRLDSSRTESEVLADALALLK